jgi:hypothetical protein
VSRDGAVAYVLWHWSRAGADARRYEEAQRGFHQSLGNGQLPGFLGSKSSALVGLPWASDGGAAYEDWYQIADSCALDALDAAVAAGGSRGHAHDTAAAGAAGATAGLYYARLGSPVSAPQFANWFSRPDGITRADLLEMLAPIVRANNAVLWMRRMVLGPAEFCLQSIDCVQLPEVIRPITVELLPLWPSGPIHPRAHQDEIANQ